MTDLAVLQFIYNWINTEINTNRSLSIPIIYGEQDAPQPDGEFIVIHRPIMTNKIGQTAGRSDTLKTDNTIDIVDNYECRVTIEECYGLGTNLRYILSSLERQSIKDLFYNNTVSFLRHESILPAPTLSENEWELRLTVDIFLAFPDNISETNTYIETVSYENGI